MKSGGIPAVAAAQGAPEHLEQEWRPRVNPWVIAVTVMLGTFMEVLDTSVANVALPHIAGNLSAGVDESTWVLTSYLVSNAVILPMSGWFSMLIGRRRFYITCVFLFTCSSMLCGVAPNLEALIFFRVLQGLGGGALQPISQAIMFESFPKEKHGMAMAVFGVGVVFAPIIGPTLGGWITDNYSWRWIFLINIPVGALSIFLTLLLIEDPPYLARKHLGEVKIDYIGFGLIALGLGCLELMLDKGEREDWFDSRLIIAAAIIVVVALAAAVIWELRQKIPIVDLRLLKERNFMLCTVTMFMLGAVLYSSTMLLPVFLQTLMGYTAMISGLVISPGGVAVVLLMPLVGWLLGRYQARWLILGGLIVTSLGLFRMAGFDLQIDFMTAVTARVVQASGLAFLFVPLNTAAFHFIPQAKTNNATGLFNLARNIGGSTGIALTTTLVARRTQYHHSVLAEHMNPFNPAYRMAFDSLVQSFTAKGASLYEATLQANAMLSAELNRQAGMLAYNDGFWLLAVSFLFLIPLVFFMKKTQPGRGGPPAH